MGVRGVKQKLVIQSSIIKQFEQMSKNAKYLKMCPSANVWFAEFC